MSEYSPKCIDTLLDISIKPDWESLVRCLMREGTPGRVHFMDLHLDSEVNNAVCERYGLLDGFDQDDPFFPYRRQVAVQRFLGYDYITAGVWRRGISRTGARLPTHS